MKNHSKGLPPKSKQNFVFTFTISNQREIPKDVAAFDGTFKGPCYILECKERPNLVGCSKLFTFYDMISINPAFIYRAYGYYNDRGAFKTTKQVLMVKLCPEIGKPELNFIYEEVDLLKTYKLRQRRGISRVKRQKIEGEEEEKDDYSWMDDLDELEKFTPAHLLSIPKFLPELKGKSDICRLDNIQFLSFFFVNKYGKLAGEQREKIRKLTTENLEKKAQMLKERPWECAFREYSDPLKPLLREQFRNVCNYLNLKVPRYIELSLELYYSCMKQMEDSKHTCFEWLTEARTSLDVVVFDSLKDEVMLFLEKYALTWIDTEKTLFALKAEYSEAKKICQALIRTACKSDEILPIITRDHVVPKLPPKLTADQEKIARHICSHYLTVVEGLPGTGKTVLIEWIMSRVKNVLICTLTGMMTKALRSRMNNRHEAAYTIDYLVSVGKYVENTGKEWLKKFEVLVIDEFSNTSTKSLSRLLEFLPNLKRIVFVGDHEQICSFEPGDAMGDIKSVYGPAEHAFRLTQILRVEETLQDLINAPTLLSQKRHRELQFKHEGPLTLVKPAAGATWGEIKPVLKGVLEQVLLRKRALMSHQIIVLQNDIRDTINQVCQELCVDMGLISPTNFQHGINIGGLFYCVGTKIAFKKNYNKESTHPMEGLKTREGADLVLKCNTVANGETGVITLIQEYRDIIYIEFIDDDDPQSRSAVKKSVVCSTNFGIKPFSIEYGYATTTMKVQGREFDMAIFWNNPWTAPIWTRPHAYVALSRGKKHVWCVSSAGNLFTICDRSSIPRKTVLSHLLQRCMEHILPSKVNTTTPFSFFGPKVPYVLLSPDVPCVPVLEQEEKKEQTKL